MFDFVAVSGTVEDRMIEFVDHLHEHFVTPIDVRHGRYWPPLSPGAGAEMYSASLQEYAYPGGPAWAHGTEAVAG
jgi:L-fuconate dehydratase